MEAGGAVMTAVTLFWAASEQHEFWVAATRHVPVGSIPPYPEAFALFACAFFPAWWIGRRLKEATRS
jgi:hypothetical protein